MANYEFAILFDPDLEVDFEKAENSFKKVIADHGGSINATDNWGKRRLAYPIKKQDSAIYVFYSVELDQAQLGAVNASLNITDEVIRFLITKPDVKKQAKAEAERAEKLKKNAARTGQDNEEAGEE